MKRRTRPECTSIKDVPHSTTREPAPSNRRWRIVEKPAIDSPSRDANDAPGSEPVYFHSPKFFVHPMSDVIRTKEPDLRKRRDYLACISSFAVCVFARIRQPLQKRAPPNLVLAGA